MIKTNLDDFSRQFNSLLDGIRQAASDISPLAESAELPKALGRAGQRRIDAQGYPELKEKYRIKTSQQRKGGKILRLTDTLYDAFGAGHGFIIGQSGGQRIEVGLSDPIARGLTRGTDKEKKKKRPVIEADQELADDAAKIMSEGIVENVRKVVQ